MAERRLMECKHMGCYELTRDKSGYCEKHRSEYENKEKERRKKYKSWYSKGNKYDAFYWGKDWKALRNHVLIRDNYLCQDCLKDHKITEATDVHHIEKIRKNWERRLDPDNCISLCGECHRKRDRQND